MKFITSFAAFAALLFFATPARAQEAQLTCRSIGDTYTECEAGQPVTTARILTQYSHVRPDGSGDCQFGKSWGFFNTRIWVNHGCYAKFAFRSTDPGPQPGPQPSPEPQPEPQPTPAPTPVPTPGEGISCQHYDQTPAVLPFFDRHFIGETHGGGFTARTCQVAVLTSAQSATDAICSWMGIGFQTYSITKNQVIGPANVGWVNADDCESVVRSTRNGFVCNFSEPYWVPYAVDSTLPAAATYANGPVGFQNRNDCQAEINNSANGFVCTWNGYSYQPFSSTTNRMMGQVNAGFAGLADCRATVAQSKPELVCNWNGSAFQGYSAKTNQPVGRGVYGSIAECYANLN